MIRYFIILFFIAITIASCSTQKHVRKQNKSSQSRKKGEFKISKKDLDLKHKLQIHYNKYKGVPYKYGGTNMKGFDCSGFVQFTYKQLFKINLPRTTGLMLKKGKPVSKNKLRIGDLVFFKTSKKYLHVGVFAGNNTFIHVSTKKGVIKSGLNNPFWIKHYLSAQRIL